MNSSREKRERKWRGVVQRWHKVPVSTMMKEERKKRKRKQKLHSRLRVGRKKNKEKNESREKEQYARKEETHAIHKNTPQYTKNTRRKMRPVPHPPTETKRYKRE